MKARLLSIDLSRKSYNVEDIPDKIIRQYLGGRGLGAYLLYKLVPAHADPLGAENHLIFSAGPASGTNFFYSSKAAVNTKSPHTGIYMYAICSTTLAHQMRNAGFWAIDIKGVADSPVYIVVKSGEVEFRDAGQLWGMQTTEAQQAMLGELSPLKASTVAIGPSGEKLLQYAAIMSGSPSRTFGRGGSGAVMGAKKLKGLAVYGDGKVQIADPVRLQEARDAIRENIAANKKWAEKWRLYGTGADLEWLNAEGAIPTRNWRGGQFEGWRGIDTGTAAAEWPRANHSCAPFCPTPCAHHIDVEKGPYKGARCDGPEWETIYAFGSTCGVDKFDAISAAGQICDEYGVDTMSAGVSIGFAMECFEKGLIGLKDTDGIELRFGNDKAMIAALKKLVNGEGFGALLSQGVRKMSARIKGSEAFAMHAKGLELGGYESRGLMGQSLQFAIDNRGGCHHGCGIIVRDELLEGNQLEVESKGEQVKKLAIGRIIRDSLSMCTFPGKIVTDPMLPGIISGLLGGSWTMDDVRKVGVRIMCQERLFNMREGIARKDDTLPERLLSEPKPDGPNKGIVVPIEKLKDSYYRAMGWDLSTGNPPDSLLAELEIKK